jgi:hypothetical protein
MYRKVIAFVLFATFMVSEGVSFLSPPRSTTDSSAASYQIKEPCPVVPLSGLEAFSRLSFVLLFFVLLPFEYHDIRRKVSRRVAITFDKRNYFYTYTTINAP